MDDELVQVSTWMAWALVSWHLVPKENFPATGLPTHPSHKFRSNWTWGIELNWVAGWYESPSATGSRTFARRNRIFVATHSLF